VTPILSITRDVIARVTPKVESAAGDLAELAKGLREQTEKMEETATEILEKLRIQAIRLDGMCSGVLNAADRAGGFVSGTVVGTVRQLSGIVAGVKAIVDSLRGLDPEARTPHTPGSRE